MQVTPGHHHHHTWENAVISLTAVLFPLHTTILEGTGYPRENLLQFYPGSTKGKPLPREPITLIAYPKSNSLNDTCLAPDTCQSTCRSTQLKRDAEDLQSGPRDQDLLSVTWVRTALPVCPQRTASAVLVPHQILSPAFPSILWFCSTSKGRPPSWSACQSYCEPGSTSWQTSSRMRAKISGLWFVLWADRSIQIFRSFFFPKTFEVARSCRGLCSPIRWLSTIHPNRKPWDIRATIAT